VVEVCRCRSVGPWTIACVVSFVSRWVVEWWRLVGVGPSVCGRSRASYGWLSGGGGSSGSVRCFPYTVACALYRTGTAPSSRTVFVWPLRKSEALRCCRVRYVIGPPRVLVGCRNSRLSFCRRLRSAGGVRASVVATFCRSHTRDVIVRVVVVSASGRLSHDPAESVRHTWCHSEFSSGRLTVTPGDVDGVCSLASRRVRLLPRHVTTSPASFKVEPNLSVIGATVIGRVSLQVDTAGIPCILIQWES
jgi:hypothetical protein